MTATSFDFPPYNYQVKDKDGNAKGWDGAEYRLTEIIGRSMNFKFELKTPTDGGLWGGKGKFLKLFIIIQSNLAIRNGLIRNKLVIRNHLPFNS